MKIDPHNADHHGKPLWVVYGPDCFPSMICCKLTMNSGELTIWGFSRYRRQGGFRTLGISLSTWFERFAGKHDRTPEFYDAHEDALACIRKLTTPGSSK